MSAAHCHSSLGLNNHLSKWTERRPGGPLRAPPISNARALYADQTKDRSGLALVPSFETQSGIALLAVCMCRSDAFALVAHQMLLRCGQQRLAFGKAHFKWIPCQLPVDGADLHTLGEPPPFTRWAPMTIHMMGLQTSTGPIFSRARPALRLPHSGPLSFKRT